MKLYQKYSALEDWVLMAATFLTTVMIFIQVINRYIFQFELTWINDTAIFVFVFLMALGLAGATRHGSHTSIEIFSSTVWGEGVECIGKLKYQIILRGVTIICLMIFLKPMWNYVVDLWKFPQYWVLVPWFNEAWLVYATFISLILCIIHCSFDIIKKFDRVEELKKQKQQ